MRSYAVYGQQADQTWARIGTFRGPRGSVRQISIVFAQRNPHADLRRIAFATRLRVGGRWVDGERVPAEVEPCA